DRKGRTARDEKRRHRRFVARRNADGFRRTQIRARRKGRRNVSFGTVLRSLSTKRVAADQSRSGQSKCVLQRRHSHGNTAENGRSKAEADSGQRGLIKVNQRKGKS